MLRVPLRAAPAHVMLLRPIAIATVDSPQGRALREALTEWVNDLHYLADLDGKVAGADSVTLVVAVRPPASVAVRIISRCDGKS